ncbi:hypothetical protein GCM10025865_14730 [Paraoerskovia sediminicola]|uniref:Cobalamin-independent methionine synthase MetE N-terminal domain-containing protein n=1 Tax=Paraoerskovia sediminicola TaxID=1138587 RepID=A0ABM8G251_9CELL|nr:hypothetical protein GCM10025865_14730 [Paraoerskovia sediminicola]
MTASDDSTSTTSTTAPTTDPTAATAPAPAVRPAFPGGTILGYPRIGRRRELKKAVESFWSGEIDAVDLEVAGGTLRRETVKRLVALGLDPEDGSVPGSFSYYDQVLDVVALLGAVPSRFADLLDEDDGSLEPEGYFTVARGRGEDAPLEMTKWFDTNYHYLVPEISESTPISFADHRIVREFAEAKEAGVTTRPVVVGPVTFLALAKAEHIDGTTRSQDFHPSTASTTSSPPMPSCSARSARSARRGSSSTSRSSSPTPSTSRSSGSTPRSRRPTARSRPSSRRRRRTPTWTRSPSAPGSSSAPRSAASSRRRATVSPCSPRPTSRRSRSTWSRAASCRTAPLRPRTRASPPRPSSPA